jgi:RNA polymerase sigma factor (sigma-70 family)
MFFLEHPELLGPFREGRRDVLDQVYRAYVRPVERYLRALARGGAEDLGQPSAISDLLQNVFVKAFSADARCVYDGLRQYAPYLSVLARNCFVDALRARRREVLKAPDDMPAGLDAPEPAGAWEPEVMAVLNAYLGGLPAPLRGIYQQRFVLGRSQDVAAATLGLSRRGVRTVEEKLRKGLRKALVRAGISPNDLRAPRARAPVQLPARGFGEPRRS